MTFKTICLELFILFIFLSNIHSQETDKIANWDFKSSSKYIKKRLSKAEISKDFSFSIEDSLTLIRRKNTSPRMLMSTQRPINLPKFFFLKVNVEKLVSSPRHVFSVMVRGDSNDRRNCEWRLPLKPSKDGQKTVYQILCQAPEGIKKMRFYLHFGIGEIKLRSVEVLKAPSPEGAEASFFSDEPLLNDPEFKSETLIKQRKTWMCSDKNFKIDSAKHEISIGKGFLRQLKIPTHFPGIYILSFEAKFKGNLALAFRSNGNFNQRFANSENEWKYYQTICPALQEKSSVAYINFQGKDFSLRNIALFQLPPNPDNTSKETTNIQEELSSIFGKHSELLKKEKEDYEQLIKSFKELHMHPYIFYQKLARLAKKAKLKTVLAK